ncbi:sigma factor [Stenotrophomonas maltophilia group sp. LNF259]
MDESTALFSRLRPRLFGVAYRMLGSSHEAEDVVQDVWLRWHGTDQSQIENPEAWLVATTTRRAIDGLRLARHAREQCGHVVARAAADR